MTTTKMLLMTIVYALTSSLLLFLHHILFSNENVDVHDQHDIIIDLLDEPSASGEVPNLYSHLSSRHISPNATHPLEGSTDVIKPADLLLSVPFYIYENEFLKDDKVLNITEMYEYRTMELHTKSNTKYTPTSLQNRTFLEYAEAFKHYKHFGDVHFIRSALQHPMRVMNPEDAKLFVVPSLLTSLIELHTYKGTPKTRENIAHKLQHMNKELGASQWFLRNDGEDHIAPVAYFNGRGVIKNKFSLLARCNIVQFHEGSGDPSYISPIYQKIRNMFTIFKVGTACSVVPFEQKTQDFAFIGKLHRKGPLDKFYDVRRNTCNWMSQANYSCSVCGKGDQCPHLSNALLGFHLRGDAWSSNRLFDTLLSGTVPVFTNEHQYGSQPQWYDWDRISYFVNVQNKTNFIHSTKEILKNKTDIMVKTKNVLDNKDLFDWQTIVPFDI